MEYVKPNACCVTDADGKAGFVEHREQDGMGS